MLKIGDYEYIYITEIKIENLYPCGILGAKQFCRPFFFFFSIEVNMRKTVVGPMEPPRHLLLNYILS